MPRLPRSIRALAFLPVPLAALPQTDGYRQLTGMQIRQAFTGRSFTDDTHFNLRYLPNGHVEGASMGRKVRFKWRVIGNELCLDEGKGDACYTVRKKGQAISLKLQDSDIALDGYLR
ncbi:hypothetical protein [Methylocella sp. CPCC 101449]|uniref:hypothetical protein n=1 Tax=Methylocella sp. CPCC 101449 TaxID=2987531 RepID=UPI00288E8229|nr:hypothetical protein [Methylocella sp. CPCC 101449]MDT2020634.1 hypothetical protein [Methylocella sp. CPCC 101449]